MEEGEESDLSVINELINRLKWSGDGGLGRGDVLPVSDLTDTKPGLILKNNKICNRKINLFFLSE